MPWHHPRKQKQARVPDQPELKPGHEDRWKKVNNSHRRSSMSMKSHLQNMIPVNPTPIVEETQQPTPEGMNIDIPTEVQEQLNQDTKTLKEVQPENTEAAPQVNGTDTKSENNS
jgi:hypothetical protein